MFLLTEVYKTRTGRIVRPAQLFDKGYAENICYTLQLNCTVNGVEVAYYGEDNTYLTEQEILIVLSFENEEFKRT